MTKYWEGTSPIVSTKRLLFRNRDRRRTKTRTTALTITLTVTDTGFAVLTLLLGA